MLRPGRHGGMTASELEAVILRNSDFLWVHRAGGGVARSTEHSTGGLYNGITGKFIAGVGGGWLPEYSRMMDLKFDCACTPGGECRSGAHGVRLKRGWRNILYELLAKRYVRADSEIRSVLGDEWCWKAKSRGLSAAPMENPEPSWNHSALTSAA